MRAVMDLPDVKKLVEVGMSHRYAQAHGWVANAVSGWLSAYYMEDARFRVRRRDHEPDTGLHVWVCEIEGAMPIMRMLKRLQADIPPFQIHERRGLGAQGSRYIIDIPQGSSDQV